MKKTAAPSGPTRIDSQDTVKKQGKSLWVERQTKSERKKSDWTSPGDDEQKKNTRIPTRSARSQVSAI